MTGGVHHFYTVRSPVGIVFAVILLLISACQCVAQSKVFIRTSTGATFAKLNHKLSIAISTNGLDWQSLHNTPTLTNFSRDASILRYGHEFVTVYSDEFALDRFGYSKLAGRSREAARGAAIERHA